MIKIKVSWIKQTWLRRAALIASTPVLLLIVFGEAAVLALLAMLCEPIRRLLEACAVIAGAWPTFKEQWRALPTPSQEGQP